MGIQSYLTAPIPRWLALTAVVGTGVAAGLTTYLVMDKRFNALFEEKVAEEVENTTRFLNAIKKVEYPTPGDAVEALYPETEQVADLIEELSYTSTDSTPTEVAASDEEETVEDADLEFDFEAEAEIRASGKPYILEYHEFQEMDKPCICLQWFDGDGVLVDQDDRPVVDANKIVGLKNLNRFGYGSRDENALYIHNPYYDTNYEIVREPGNYVDQAYGGHIQHQFDQGGDRKRTLRKFHLDEE
jgi:hypothetical protein